jgi:hypothetical protein
MASPALETPIRRAPWNLVAMPDSTMAIEPDQPQAPVAFAPSTGWAGNSLSYRPETRRELNPDGFETFCAPFAFDQRAVGVGTPIRLREGQPPSIHLQSGRRIGEIGTGIKFLIEIRIEDGCCLTGLVSMIDPRGDTGLLALACVRPRAARAKAA